MIAEKIPEERNPSSGCTTKDDFPSKGITSEGKAYLYNIKLYIIWKKIYLENDFEHYGGNPG